MCQDTIKNVKRQPTEREEVSAKHVSDRGPVSRVVNTTQPPRDKYAA